MPALDHTALDALTLETATREDTPGRLCLSGAAHAYRQCIRSLQAHRKPHSLQYSCPSGAKHTLRGNRLLKPNPQDFCYNIWGAYPTLDRPGIATEQTKLHLTLHGFYTLQHQPRSLSRGQSQHARKDVAGIYIKEALMPKTLDKTQSTQGHSPRKYPFKTTIGNFFS